MSSMSSEKKVEATQWIKENSPENGVLKIYWSEYGSKDVSYVDTGFGQRYEIHFKDGKRADGVSKGWYCGYGPGNGHLKQIITWKDGKENGISTGWFPDGIMWFDGNYKDGKEVGLWTQWHRNGQKDEERIVINNEKVYYKKWDGNGKQILHPNYDENGFQKNIDLKGQINSVLKSNNYFVSYLYQPLWNFIVEKPPNFDSNPKARTYRAYKCLWDKSFPKEFDYRMNLILSEVDNLNSTFIDIGCAQGYNSFEIYKSGGNVTGVDPNTTELPDHLIDYHKLDRSRIKFVTLSIQDYFDYNSIKYDYCICLLLLHHFFTKDKSDTFFTPTGCKIIKNIYQRCNIATFIQMRFNTNHRYWTNFDTNENFVDYLIKHIGFSDVKVFKYDHIPEGYYDNDKNAFLYKCIK